MPPSSPPPPPSLPQQHNASASLSYPPPPPPPPSNLCFGGECYRVTHLVVSGLCALGALCMLVLTRRTRAFYASPR